MLFFVYVKHFAYVLNLLYKYSCLALFNMHSWHGSQSDAKCSLCETLEYSKLLSDHTKTVKYGHRFNSQKKLIQHCIHSVIYLHYSLDTVTSELGKLAEQGNNLNDTILQK